MLLSLVFACTPEPEGDLPENVNAQPSAGEQSPAVEALMGTTPAIPEIIEVCQDCDLVIDWGAVEVWSDGTPVDPERSEIVFFCFYQMTVEDFEAAMVWSTCPRGSQAMPWEVENRSITIPAMATPGTPGVGVVGLWIFQVAQDIGRFTNMKYIVGAPEGTDIVFFE